LTSAGQQVEPLLTDEVSLPVRQAAASPPLRRILILVDAVAVAFSFFVASSLLTFVTGARLPAALLVAGFSILGPLAGLMLFANGLYRRRICTVRSAEIVRIAQVAGVLAAVVGVLLALALTPEQGFVGALLTFVTLFATVTLERGVLREWIHSSRAGGDFSAPVLVAAGNRASGERLAGFFSENPVFGFHPQGVVDVGGTETATDVAPAPAAHRVIREAHVVGATGVVLDAASLTGGELSSAAEILTAAGLHVHISSGLRGIDRRRITVSPLADETFLHVVPSGLPRRQAVVKRALDVTVASFGLFVWSPVLLVSGLIIWAQDRGPILFRQERVGHHGERFLLYKLRTMSVDADARRAELEGDNARNGPLFKLDRDPRVTPFGRFLRASSIDEIPQLFNVLEGTMSMVGPRPALPDEVAEFDEQLVTRATVKPGVTGLWQVEARDLPSFDLYRRYDLLYVRNWTVGFDAAIIAHTVTVVGIRSLRALVPARLRRGRGYGLE
jgi:exopolysaccharide biosynthesis polyprenyl glycosylphosphotransferase